MKTVRVTDPTSAAVVKAAAEAVSSGEDFIALTSGTVELLPAAEVMIRAVGFNNAAIAYCDYLEADGTLVSLTDCLSPLRDDFNMGPLIVTSANLLADAAAEIPANLNHAALYALRLALSRRGRVIHNPVTGYRLTDTGQGGPGQFDYVDPRNRAVQAEMELAVTDHLRRVGALVNPLEFPAENIDAGDFAVEASVIIPVRNRVNTVADAVASALSQHTDFTFNVIVVDNHSTDGTTDLLVTLADADPRIVHIIPENQGHGIGGCWNIAIDSPRCGRYAVQLDSDDLYSSADTLQQIVDTFRRERPAMVIGSYMLTDFSLRKLPPGLIDHREWTPLNGPNNLLRVNGAGAPRAFLTSAARMERFPDVSYGEDYSMVLALSGRHRTARIFSPLYMCRRWEGNSDANPSRAQINSNNRYKDTLRLTETNRRTLECFHASQLAAWDTAAEAYGGLANIVTRTVNTRFGPVTLQHNPGRVRSTAANLDEKRPCFLCDQNRPAQQGALYWRNYAILVNPYPIFPQHFTVVSRSHRPQALGSAELRHMAELADKYHGFTVFFNGAGCGASAPDHLHFQMVLSRYVAAWRNSLSPALRFDNLDDACRWTGGRDDSMLNILCQATPDHDVKWLIYDRKAHRPACFHNGGIMVSPGAIDMAGTFVLPRRKDFDSVTASDIENIITEVTNPPRP